VRQQVAAAPTFIKLFASTGTDDDVTGFETYSYDEIQSRRLMPLTSSAKNRHPFLRTRWRARRRPRRHRLPEHATDMDDATIQEMARRGTFYCNH